jgi:hypothetical protein
VIGGMAGRNELRTALRRLVPLAAALTILLGSTPGADFGGYVDWAQVFFHGDITLLRSATASPMGVPLSIWSHGPGLLAGTLHFALPTLLTAQTALYLAGWLSALLFWWLACDLILRASRHDVWLSGFGLVLLFVATHAGYYTRSHASESLCFGPLAVLTWLALRRRRLTAEDWIYLGVSVGLLLTLRSYLAVYALPAIVRGLLDIGIRRPRRLFAAAAFASTPALLGVACVGMVNRWMTGNALRSPYSFGEAGFRSLDWWSPEVWAVIAHPWHGLVSYHPIYLVAVPAGAWLLLQRHDAGRRPVLLAFGVAMIANLYIVAAWFVWWMGTGTFGMRGLAPTALPAALAIVWLVRRSMHAPWAPLIGAAAVASSAWSFLLVRSGETNLTSYHQLMAHQEWSAGGLGSTLVGAIVLGGLAALRRSSTPRWLRFSAVAVAALAVADLVLAAWRPTTPAVCRCLSGPDRRDRYRARLYGRSQTRAWPPGAPRSVACPDGSVPGVDRSVRGYCVASGATVGRRAVSARPVHLHRARGRAAGRHVGSRVSSGRRL